jgi:hypothetical protein
MEKPGRGKDREMIEMFKSSLPEDELSLLVAAIRDKVGSPDLLLFKEGRLSFVEVKADYETVKPCTVRFFLQYGKNWPLCITRVNCVKAA